MTAAQHSIAKAARWLKRRATATSWVHGEHLRISPAITMHQEPFTGMNVR